MSADPNPLRHKTVECSIVSPSSSSRIISPSRSPRTVSRSTGSHLLYRNVNRTAVPFMGNGASFCEGTLLSFRKNEGERDLGEEYVRCIKCRKTLTFKNIFHFEYTYSFIQSLISLHCASMIKGDNTPIKGNICAPLTAINTKNRGTKWDKAARLVNDKVLV